MPRSAVFDRSFNVPGRWIDDEYTPRRDDLRRYEDIGQEMDMQSFFASKNCSFFST